MQHLFSEIVSAATLLTIFEERFDIMLTRFRAARAKDKKLKAEALEAARAEGYAAAKAENTATADNSPKPPKKSSK